MRREIDKNPLVDEENEVDIARLNSLEDSILFDQVASYLRSLPKMEARSYEEDKAAAIQIKTGTPEERQAARKELAESVLRMVVSEALKRGRNDENLIMDLIGAGNLAVVEKAVEKYDERKGTKFNTYAMCWIRQAQMRAVNKISRPFTVSDNVELDIRSVKKASSRLLTENGREPTASELEKSTGLSAERVDFALKVINQRSISLNEEAGEDEGEELIDTISYPVDTQQSVDIAYTSELIFKINEEIKYLERLDELNAKRGIKTRHGEILRLRTGISADGIWTGGFLSSEISEMYNISSVRVGQLQIQALGKIADDKMRETIYLLLSRHTRLDFEAK